MVGGIYIGSEHDTCLPITFNGRLHHQEPFLQKLFSIHSVPSPLSDRKAKLVHYISSLSREPLFRTRTLPYLLEFDSVAFLTYVQVQNQGLFCSSHPCKCQSLFNQANLLNRKPLIRVRPGLPPPPSQNGFGAMEGGKKVRSSALMGRALCINGSHKCLSSPAKDCTPSTSPLTEHQTQVQK